MKLSVDAARCQGHTICAMVAPELVRLSDLDGHATAVDGEVPAQAEAGAREAVGSCPERAISLS
ncbi:ferredoxin [Nocardia vaccinii]|uniref:ferredoxin n=1 Tax=Nocardia vaccinii TaxID=1822 RepID=UPI00083069FF|nr:ferredoxin [Nocardia vaccinii]